MDSPTFIEAFSLTFEFVAPAAFLGTGWLDGGMEKPQAFSLNPVDDFRPPENQPLSIDVDVHMLQT
jgi:hypothetical protein